MGGQTLEFQLKAALAGGTTAAFTTLSNAFKMLGKEMKGTAKDLYAMGKTETADSLGHVAMAIGRVGESFKSMAATGKDATKTVTQGTKALKDYSKEVVAVNQAWNVFSKGGTVTGTSLKAAESWTNRFSTAIGTLRNNLIAGGQSMATADSWLNKLDFSKVMSGMKSGDLKLVGSNLDDIRGKGYALIGMNKDMIQSLGSHNKAQTLYNKELERSKGVSKAYQDAVISLGKSHSTNNERAKIWIPTLNSVQNAMERTRTSAIGTGNGFYQLTKDTNLAGLAQAVLQGI